MMRLKVYVNGHENGRKPRKGTQKRVNEFFTNLPPKTWTSMQYNDLIRNLILQRKNYIYSLHYLTGQNRGLSRLKNIWSVIMTGDLLSVILSPEYLPLFNAFHSTKIPVWILEIPLTQWKKGNKRCLPLLIIFSELRQPKSFKVWKSISVIELWQSS